MRRPLLIVWLACNGLHKVEQQCWRSQLLIEPLMPPKPVTPTVSKLKEIVPAKHIAQRLVKPRAILATI